VPAGGVAPLDAVPTVSTVADGLLLVLTNWAPTLRRAIAARIALTATPRLRRFLRLAAARRSRNRSFGSTGGKSIDTAAWTLSQ
jgi:hypothetical protein